VIVAVGVIVIVIVAEPLIVAVHVRGNVPVGVIESPSSTEVPQIRDRTGPRARLCLLKWCAQWPDPQV
jgi:hypothetical protein